MGIILAEQPAPGGDKHPRLIPARQVDLHPQSATPLLPVTRPRDISHQFHRYLAALFINDRGNPVDLPVETGSGLGEKKRQGRSLGEKSQLRVGQQQGYQHTAKIPQPEERCARLQILSRLGVALDHLPADWPREAVPVKLLPQPGLPGFSGFAE
jgi:hypothetical protein